MTPENTNKRAARGRATREQLIEVATRLFAENGYEDTSIEDVLAAAGVSRGALYHHFAGKDALFEAVVDSVEASVMATLMQVGADAPDAVTHVKTIVLAWIGMAGDPVIQRVILLDGPSVLGLERWYDPEKQQAFGAMSALLRAVADEGRLAPELIRPFAHMILGAMDEMAIVVARAPDSAAAIADARPAVEEMLNRLLVG
ncbi:MAG: TetR/AcrR family transcriptional regulator [Trebonia sp.]